MLWLFGAYSENLSHSNSSIESVCVQKTVSVGVCQTCRIISRS